MGLIDRIVTKMQQLNITKAELQKKSGLKKSTFYNIFDKKTNTEKIKLETIRAIAIALNTTLDFLIYGTPENVSINNDNYIFTVAYNNNTVIYELKPEDAKVITAFLEKHNIKI